MNWLLVAIMATVHVPQGQDIFVFTQPTFGSSKECIQYVQENPQALNLKLRSEFPSDKLERLLCVTEKNVEKFLKTTVQLDNKLET